MAGWSFLSGEAWRSGRGLDDARSGRQGLWILALVVLGALFALYLLAVWFDWLPVLRGVGSGLHGRIWSLYPTPHWTLFLPAIAIIAAMWVVVTLVEMSSYARQAADPRGNRAIKALYLLLMVLLGYGLQLALLDLRSGNGNALMFERVTNRDFTGYFTLASSAPDAGTFFIDYPGVLTTSVCPRCQFHPPGPALYYWLNIKAAGSLSPGARATLAGWVSFLLGTDPRALSAENGLSDSQVLGAFMGGTLVLLLAAAVVLPLYGLARYLGPPGWEYRLAALGVVLPGIALTAPRFNQVFGLISAVVIYLAVRGLLADDGLTSALWGSAAGLGIALGIYFSWSLVTLLGLVVALGLACILFSRRALVTGEIDDARTSFTGLAGWVTGLVFGAAIPLLLVAFAGQTDMGYIFRYNVDTLESARAQTSRFLWLITSPKDFLQFLGLPLALAAIWAILIPPWQHFPPSIRLDERAPAGVRAAFRVPWHSRVNVYAWLLWATVIAAAIWANSIAGQTLLLIFLMPLALAAVYLWAGRANPPSWVIAALFFAEVAVCLVIDARWIVP